MKRYNIHIDDDWIKELDKITETANKTMYKKNLWGNMKRADTIRIAIATFYNLKLPCTWGSSGEFIKIIKQISKKRLPE